MNEFTQHFFKPFHRPFKNQHIQTPKTLQTSTCIHSNVTKPKSLRTPTQLRPRKSHLMIEMTLHERALQSAREAGRSPDGGLGWGRAGAGRRVSGAEPRGRSRAADPTIFRETAPSRHSTARHSTHARPHAALRDMRAERWLEAKYFANCHFCFRVWCFFYLWGVYVFFLCL